MFIRIAGVTTLLCLLAGCGAAAPREDSPCVAGNPIGSVECQTRVYRDAP